MYAVYSTCAIPDIFHILIYSMPFILYTSKYSINAIYSIYSTKAVYHICYMVALCFMGLLV